MEELFSDLVKQLRPEFDKLLYQEQETGNLRLWDEELQDAASCCTTGEVAAFYLCDSHFHGGDGKEIAAKLGWDVRDRQHPSGGFRQPYFARKGEEMLLDIAEIGAVANSLYHLFLEAGSLPAKESLLAAADYLLTQVNPSRPGVIYKNPNATNHDVLNGDVYAAHAFTRAFQVTGNHKYMEQTENVLRHIAERFGQHHPGWWPYTENWDGSVHMGNSVSYQATIVAFAHPSLPAVQDDVRELWGPISVEATETILQALSDGPSDENEEPWWCRDWNNAWEIYLALWRHRDKEEARERLQNRLLLQREAIQRKGIACFTPAVSSSEPDRAPVTTTFRKAATFAGILAYMILDAKNE